MSLRRKRCEPRRVGCGLWRGGRQGPLDRQEQLGHQVGHGRLLPDRSWQQHVRPGRLRLVPHRGVKLRITAGHRLHVWLICFHVHLRVRRWAAIFAAVGQGGPFYE
ncbi:hypothetical protein L915_09225 [Phytophthora nicotianae]|uniref:Uncharacterized protein n=1 Tax=Phytophthora nicotianae TaxID=4792 RepID=W2GSX6_PHYNI|nr:hypothetical protein L915_09225 [Phytophthora nicotianae]